jgi:hypothetical protein
LALVLPLAPWLSVKLGVRPNTVGHAAELVVALAAVGVLISRERGAAVVLKPLAIPLGALIAYWLFTDLWNLVAWRTAVVGLRGDLRFLPAVVLAVAVGVAWIDRWFMGIFVGGAIAQALLALAYSADSHVLQTTLQDRNQLGIYLVLALLAVIVRIGSSNWQTQAPVLLVLVAGLVASASREGAVAGLVGASVVLFLRGGRRVKLVTAAAAVVGAAVLLVPTIAGTGSGYLDATGTTARWRELFSANLSPATNFRSKLLVENARLVAAHEPVFGFGVGTGSAPQVITDLSSPLYRSFLAWPLQMSIEPFVYDSNWATIELETGFLGLAAFVALLGFLASLGLAPGAGTSGMLLVASLASLAFAGFAGPVFREALPAFLLWILVGTCLARRPVSERA